MNGQQAFQGGFPQQQGGWGAGPQGNWGAPPQAGGYPQGSQGGYQGGGQTGGNSNGNGNKGNYDSFCEITLIGNISGITDPETNQRVHAYSKPMNNGAKVANTNIAVNHYGKDEADFWKLEVWANSPERSRLHNFLMDHCSIGRKLFIKGIPMLNYDKEKKVYYPTIRVTELIGLGGGQNSNGNGNSNGSGGGQANGGYQQQSGQQGWGNQQGFPPQQNGFAGPNPNMQQQGAGWGGPQGGFAGPQGGFGAPQGAPGQFQGQR
jgi:hypothetical protein